jgi:hypothetical protein
MAGNMYRKSFYPVFFLMVSVMAAPPAAASEVGVWGIKAPGVDQSLAKQLVSELEKSISGLAGNTLVESARLQQRLEKAGILPGTPWDKVWPALGLDWIVTGTMTGIGEHLAVDLRLVNGREGSELRRIAAELAVEAELRAGQMTELAVRLLAPEKWKGSLLVETSVSGASIFLDEQQLGVTPLAAPLENLAPGKHILRVVKEGYADFSHFVNIKFNQLAQVKVNLENSLVEGLLYQDDTARPAPAPAAEALHTVVVQPSRLPAWLALGAALAAGAAGTALWLKDYRAPAAVLMAAAGVAAAGSTLALVLAWPRREEPAPVSQKAAFRPTGLVLIWSADF